MTDPSQKEIFPMEAGLNLSPKDEGTETGDIQLCPLWRWCCDNVLRARWQVGASDGAASHCR